MLPRGVFAVYMIGGEVANILFCVENLHRLYFFGGGNKSFTYFFRS